MFCEDVKREIINKSIPDEQGEEMYSELYGMLNAASVLVVRGGRLNLLLECEYDFVARRFSMLLAKAFNLDSELFSSVTELFGGRTKYSVRADDSAGVKEMLRYYGILGFGDDIPISNGISESFLSTEEALRSYLRAVFLVCGYVSEPSGSGYLLSFTLLSEQYGENLSKLLGGLNFSSSLRRKGTQYVLTLRSSDQISDFLALCGAYSGVLSFESVVTDKEMKNVMTRKVNCDTANISRTVNASLRQIRAIEQLIRRGELAKLPPNLILAAQLRLDHPEESLNELAKGANPPISRSTLDKRLRRLVELGEAQQ